MILATYQPINDDKSKQEWNELEQFLGYRPIFCFSANSAQEMIINSILAAPNCPEKLIIFETNEFVELDIVQYNKKIAIEYQSNKDNRIADTITIDNCFTSKSSDYKEFVVEKITNIIEEINLLDAFFMVGESRDGEYATEINNIVDSTTNTAREFLKYSCKVDVEEIDDITKLSMFKKKIIKEGFQLYILPLVCQSIFGQNLLDMIQFDTNTYFYTTLQNDLSKFYNPEENIKYKTYAFYDSLVLRLKKCASRTLSQNAFESAKQKMRKVSLNAPCPCGSGKKYKRCCGKQYK